VPGGLAVRRRPVMARQTKKAGGRLALPVKWNPGAGRRHSSAQFAGLPETRERGPLGERQGCRDCRLRLLGRGKEGGRGAC